MKDALDIALPKSVSEFWERAERNQPVAMNKLEDEAWEIDRGHYDLQERRRTRSNAFMNEFGMRNPHGMGRENAFVNEQI